MLKHNKIFTLLLICLLCSFAVQGDAAEPPWKFAIVSDTRGSNTDTPGKSCINTHILKQIAASIVKEGCELVIVPGDIGVGVGPRQLTDITQHKPLKTPFSTPILTFSGAK